MKITKYVHSCLLIEADEAVVLADPGTFSWESGLFSVDNLQRLDYITVSHEHPDHLNEAFLKALVSKFPSVRIITNSAIAARLQASGYENVSTQGDTVVQPFATQHESVQPFGEVPDHVGVHVLDRLTHPGDSHHFTETKEILALPMTGPWGSFMAAVSLALKLQPKYVLPIHDWHWNDTARARAYDDAARLLAEHNITFVKTRDGESFEL